MSLGVLNNLSALYAAGNLNNTNNSLSKTLQQLSSGSKINSGADDAAGLSLVNGLGANATALSQSQTNATEGAGLLQVADGALSQVTNLLNRAVTLATEVSNGTLNSSQQSAANQEYQSILSEVNNIGSTTTYNQQTVFGHNFSIYTGDSSIASASQDALSIGSLSSTSLGQSSGTMSYTAGNSVFIDLSTAAANAANSNSLDAAKHAITFTYSTGTASDGSYTVGTKAIGAPGTDVTVGGLINAINSSGLGITASLGTDAQAGSGTTGHTGIIITGNLQNAGATSGSFTAMGQVYVGNGAAGGIDVLDSSTTKDQSASTAAASGTTGMATISYTGGAGVDLHTTNLTAQASAEGALTTLNSAIAAVASQDGYIGAQINTLNAVSSVISTQQQNITAAQNAVQATDYAQASSNLSKYEILSQTGISALAQANSLQQEVTKLLQ
jgi:flagellin